MIKCTVDNCSHNKSEVCYSNRIDIGGSCSKESCDTCCGSFLNKNHYGDLTNNIFSNSTIENSPCDWIVCSAITCKFNDASLCTLESINVGSNKEVQLYTEANCISFKER